MNSTNSESHPSAAESPHSPLTEKVDSVIEAYAGGAREELPIGGYALMMSLFAVSCLGLLGIAKSAGVLPRRIPIRDILLLGVATHKLTRIITRDRVAIPLRAPFTRYQGTDGAGLVKEDARGSGVQRAVGSVLTCQFCSGPWVALGLSGCLLFAPRATRAGSSLFAMVAVSDFLHQAYAGARRWSDPDRHG